MDPFTIGAGLGAVGHLFSGIMGFFGGNSQAKAYQAAAQQANNEAGVNAQIALQQGDRTAASAAVRAAAGGGGFTGSSIGVIQDLSQQAMYNARAQVYRGQTQSQADLYQAQVAKANAGDSLIGGVFGSASSLLGGMAQSAAQARYGALLSQSRGLGGGGDYDYDMMGG